MKISLLAALLSSAYLFQTRLMFSPILLVCLNISGFDATLTILILIIFILSDALPNF